MDFFIMGPDLKMGEKEIWDMPGEQEWRFMSLGIIV